MIHTARTVRTLQAVAVSVAIAVFLWSTGLTAIFHSVEAAQLTNASDTLTNSAPSETSVHQIAFTTENGMLANAVFSVTFPDGFDISNLTLDSISMTVYGVATTVAGTNGVDQWGVATGTHHVTFTAPSDEAVASSTSLVLTIGNELSNMIVNPSATSSYQIGIGTDSATTTITDSGSVRVAIIDTVTVSASVDTTLEFYVSSVAQGANVNGTSTTAASTQTTIPFGTLSPNQLKTIAQRLNVITNATNGYNVTVEYATELISSTGATIDGFANGNYTQTPTGWVPPSADVTDNLTWGHWGVTSDDSAILARSSQFGSNQWVSGSTSPISVMGHNQAADGVTNGIGSTTVGYQIEISSLQEAGSDYTTSLRYIATPTF